MSEYIDGGYSGSNLNRPAIEQLQKDICHKKINAVIVYRLDRLSRSQHDTLYLIEKIFYQIMSSSFLFQKRLILLHPLDGR